MKNSRIILFTSILLLSFSQQSCNSKGGTHTFFLNKELPPPDPYSLFYEAQKVTWETMRSGEIVRVEYQTATKQWAMILEPLYNEHWGIHHLIEVNTEIATQIADDPSLVYATVEKNQITLSSMKPPKAERRVAQETKTK